MGRPKQWKGKIIRDLRSAGAALNNDPAEFKKGDVVICKRRNSLDARGGFEYHYEHPTELKLVRSREFLIEE